MDISKASNLERFIFDLLGRNAERLAAAWRTLDETGELDLSDELPRFEAEFGLVSGTSTHADRVATIAAQVRADPGGGVLGLLERHGGVPASWFRHRHVRLSRAGCRPGPERAAAFDS